MQMHQPEVNDGKSRRTARKPRRYGAGRGSGLPDHRHSDVRPLAYESSIPYPRRRTFVQPKTQVPTDSAPHWRRERGSHPTGEKNKNNTDGTL